MDYLTLCISVESSKVTRYSTELCSSFYSRGNELKYGHVLCTWMYITRYRFGKGQQTPWPLRDQGQEESTRVNREHVPLKVKFLDALPKEAKGKHFPYGQRQSVFKWSNVFLRLSSTEHMDMDEAIISFPLFVAISSNIGTDCKYNKYIKCAPFPNFFFLPLWICVHIPYNIPWRKLHHKLKQTYRIHFGFCVTIVPNLLDSASLVIQTLNSGLLLPYLILRINNHCTFYASI